MSNIRNRGRRSFVTPIVQAIANKKGETVEEYVRRRTREVLDQGPAAHVVGFTHMLTRPGSQANANVKSFAKKHGIKL